MLRHEQQHLPVMYSLHCVRCGHSWQARTETVDKCSKCKSIKYDTPYTGGSSTPRKKGA